MIEVALFEKLEMVRRAGERYEEYRRRTPFMIPLPKRLREIPVRPMRKTVKGYPRSTKDVIVVLALYIAILIVISYLIELTITLALG